MPYDPKWDLLCVCSIEQYIDRAGRAGIPVTLESSKIEPTVRYLSRVLDDGKELRAGLPPDDQDRYTTVRYFCDRLQIPRKLFGV